MPWSYSIDPIRKLINTRIIGSITPVEADAFYHAVIGDAAFDASYSELMDATEADGSKLPTAKICECGTRAPYSSSSKRAILVKTDLALGLARMYSAYADTHSSATIRVFSDRAEALTWLNTVGEDLAAAGKSSV